MQFILQTDQILNLPLLPREKAIWLFPLSHQFWTGWKAAALRKRAIL